MSNSEAMNTGGRVTIDEKGSDNESPVCCGYFEDVAIVCRNFAFQQQINLVA